MRWTVPSSSSRARATLATRRRSEEALSIWGHDAVLADVVLAIRRFRPDVIITRFPHEDGDTHGQHTASTKLAVEAFTRPRIRAYMPDAEHRRFGPWKARRLVWNESGRFGEVRDGARRFPAP